MPDFTGGRLMVTVEEHDGVVVVHLSGAIDLDTVAEVRAAGLAQITRPQCTALLVDAGAVDFIDSTGIGGLIEIANCARDSQKRFQVVNVTPQAARILDIVGLRHLYSPAPG